MIPLFGSWSLGLWSVVFWSFRPLTTVSWFLTSALCQLSALATRYTSHVTRHSGLAAFSAPKVAGRLAGKSRKSGANAAAANSEEGAGIEFEVLA